jgi:hypothetical protein
MVLPDIVPVDDTMGSYWCTVENQYYISHQSFRRKGGKSQFQRRGGESRSFETIALILLS